MSGRCACLVMFPCVRMAVVVPAPVAVLGAPVVVVAVVAVAGALSPVLLCRAVVVPVVVLVGVVLVLALAFFAVMISNCFERRLTSPSVVISSSC